MITYFIDFIYGLSIVGILAGIVLIVDGMRRLKEQKPSEPLSSSGPRMTWIYLAEAPELARPRGIKNDK